MKDARRRDKETVSLTSKSPTVPGTMRLTAGLSGVFAYIEGTRFEKVTHNDSCTKRAKLGVPNKIDVQSLIKTESDAEEELDAVAEIESEGN